MVPTENLYTKAVEYAGLTGKERSVDAYDFTEDYIAVMKIYGKVKQEERMAVYGCQAADKEIR